MTELARFARSLIILHAKTFSGFSLMIMKFIHIMYVRVSMQAHNSRGLYSSVCHITRE